MDSKNEEEFFNALKKAIKMQALLEAYMSNIKDKSKFLEIFSQDEIMEFNFHERSLCGILNDMLEKLACRLEEYQSEEEALEDLKRIRVEHQIINDFVLNSLDIMRRKMTIWEKIEFFFKSIFSKKNKGGKGGAIVCH